MTLELRGRHDALEYEARERVRLAWQIEAFARTERLKRLDHYLKPSEPRAPMSPDQLLAVARRWDRALNGPTPQT